MSASPRALPKPADPSTAFSRALQQCPDCPSARMGRLPGLLSSGSGGCALQSLSVEARQPLPAHRFGDHRLALVRRGFIVRQRVDRQGRATAIDAVGPGGVFAITAPGPDTPTSLAGYAATSATLCLCTKESLEAQIHTGDRTALDLHELQLQALERMERMADARARASASARVAALLLAFADTLSPAHDISVRVPPGLYQRDLAALLGMRHESVCRVLRELQRSGAIEKARSGVRILDRAMLEAA